MPTQVCIHTPKNKLSPSTTQLR